ncbi:hypothetical protein OG336_00190 [[Kitasatospora] papulosa]|uniref:hypothetical protein n=1 Tax=[Kitasatospora] papulosa TaxID=1464011 RepID=UPI002E0E3DDF|nr:hypothetical protein OG336_00190 [[Kitasatospora] papulosa]
MDIAMIRRSLNGTLTELHRAVDRFDVTKAADLFEWAWHQASQAPPRETREQRAQLKVLKEVLGSRRWREEEQRLAAQEPRPQPDKVSPAPRPRSTKRPASNQAPVVRPRTVWSSDTPRAPAPDPVQSPARMSPPAPVTRDPSPARAHGRSVSREGQPGRLGAGRLAELATDLRPLLEQTARAGSTTTWTVIRKRLPALVSLHRDDESVLLWLVDDDRDQSEPLLSALVTVGDRQMHPRFPTIAEQLGVPAGRSSTQQRSTWNYEVLKAHQYWRHRH